MKIFYAILLLITLTIVNYTNAAAEIISIDADRTIHMINCIDGISYNIISHNKEVSYEVISRNNAAFTMKISRNGKSSFEVVATIATSIIPSAVKGICLMTVRNPKICRAVYDVSAGLVESYKEDIKEGITEGIKWTAKKARKVSSATIKTKSREIADGAEKVFSEYKKRKCVKYNTPKINIIRKSKPSLVVNVFNANGYNGSAKNTAIKLKRKIPNISFRTIGNNRFKRSKTIIIYKQGFRQSANNIAYKLPGDQFPIPYNNSDHSFSGNIAVIVGTDLKRW